MARFNFEVITDVDEEISVSDFYAEMSEAEEEEMAELIGSSSGEVHEAFDNFFHCGIPLNVVLHSLFKDCSGYQYHVLEKLLQESKHGSNERTSNTP